MSKCEEQDGADEKFIEGKAKAKKMSWGEKFTYFRSHITVEPMLACYIMPSVLASLATQNLSLEKACRVNLQYDTEICDALTARNTFNYTTEEVEVQQLVVKMTIWKTIVQSAIPAALLLFIGSWSDRWGRRKPCMLFPIVGEFLTSMGFIICTYFFFEFPMEVTGAVEAILPAITGGWYTMFMAVFSYMGDVTNLETRTLRIGIVNVFISLGVPIGMAFSGVLYVKLGFYGVFSISSTFYVISFFYGYFRIKDVNKVQKTDKSGTCCAAVADFFDIKHVKETFKVCFKEGKRNRKNRVIMLMVVVMVIIGPMHGEYTMMYLFTRYRFNWNEIDFSMFTTYSMMTNLLGTMLSVGVFSHLLKFDDAIIGVLSCTSKILSCFVYAFATTTWAIYLAPVVEILNGTSFIAMRSIASKLVPADELGKVNSLFGVCESLVPFLYGPMYSAVYAATMNTLPGTIFLLSGALNLPAVFIFFWMYTEHNKDKREDELFKAEKEKLNGDTIEMEKLGDDQKKSQKDSIRLSIEMENNSNETNGLAEEQEGAIILKPELAINKF